MEVLKC